jgi:propionyl-CoA carboxylase alpha chain
VTIGSVLVANRGEIARRVFRTCRDLGIATIAVFSDADAGAPHVHEADSAVRLPGTAAADTYLRTDLIVAAAQRAGAQAIHPGYGFLSENPDFARAVTDAGLVWVGPPAEAIAAMGSKIEAKRLMAAAGVPVLPELNPERLDASELPVLLKASSGGGGRGMRVVRDLAELAAAVEVARAEALSAFGDPTVFAEPYLAAGRHIEVQVLADGHGTVWTIGERECSIQRRHQKVIEEMPSPLVERIDGMRAELFAAAEKAARAIGYAGAGTVEFIADDAGHFHFLEMNTRLQVEHPVTECTTGLDLVALQLHIAEGGHLTADPPAARGHSIEARLYAEDPAADWQPQSGTVHRVDIPGVTTRFDVATASSGIRVDTGVENGSVVPPYYDPLLGKVIAWAPQRAHAARLLSTALAAARVHGITTNRDLLVNVLRHKEFLAGDTDTAFTDRHGIDSLTGSLVADPERAALAAALALDAARPRPLSGIPPGWRNVPSQPQQISIGDHEIKFRFTRDGLQAGDGIDLVSAAPDEVTLDVYGVRHRFGVAMYGNDVYVDTPTGGVRFRVKPRLTDSSTADITGSLRAPMPGSVVRIAVSAGDSVRRGEPVLWLEAMKMQHRIDAPAGGVITELPVRAGQQVETGTVLAVINEGDAK